MKTSIADQLRALPISEIHGTVSMSTDLRNALLRELERMPVVESVAVPVVTQEPVVPESPPPNVVIGGPVAPAPTKHPARKVAKKK